MKQEKVEKEKEKEKEKEIEKEKEVENKKESVQELEKQLEQETKEINTEVETELKKASINNTLEYTHQENFGINPTQSKPKEVKEKSPSSSQNKKEQKSSKNYHSSETPSFNPYSMFPPMFNPMMMPPSDSKGGQPMYYMIPVPVDMNQFPKEYWQNLSAYYPMMQNMYQANFNKQNSNSKK